MENLSNYTCPITRQLFWNPVIAEDGHVYEKSAIDEWFKKNKISPITREKIGTSLNPILLLKNIIDDLVKLDPKLSSNRFTALLNAKSYEKVIQEFILEKKFDKLKDYENYNEKIFMRRCGIEKHTYLSYLLTYCDFDTLKYIFTNYTKYNNQIKGFYGSHIIAMYGSEKLILYLLKKTTLLQTNKLTKFGYTIVHIFCERSFNKAIKYALSKNYLLMLSHNVKVKPFTLLCKNKNYEMINYLIENKNNFSIDKHIFQFLDCDILAKVLKYISMGDSDLVKILICKTQKYYLIKQLHLPIEFDKEHNLYQICKYGNTEVIKLHFDAGCDFNIQSGKKNESCIMLLCRRKFLKVLDYIIEQKFPLDFKSCDADGWYLIHYICRYGNLKIVQKVIQQYNPDLTVTDVSGQTPGHIVCYNHHTIAKYIFDLGIDLEVADNDGMNILHTIISQESNRILIKYLVQVKKVNLESEDNRGYRPVHYMCEYGVTEEIKWFIEQGVDLNAKSIKGVTPLAMACMYSTPEIIKFMIEDKKTDLEVQLKNSYRPLHYILMNQPVDMIEYILKMDIDKTPPKGKTLEILLSFNDFVRKLIKQRFNV